MGFTVTIPVSPSDRISPRRIDLVGERFGRLVVIADLGSRFTGAARQKTRFWKCKCDCGADTQQRTGQLRSGMARSCGCLQRDTTAQRSRKHGHAPRGERPPEYVVWKNMRKRCRNPDPKDAPYYADRGIAVCDRWKNFENFYEDMGPRPSAKHSIDRIDVNGGYSPDNCRWATTLEQRHNRRDYIARRG